MNIRNYVRASNLHILKYHAFRTYLLNIKCGKRFVKIPLLLLFCDSFDKNAYN